MHNLQCLLTHTLLDFPTFGKILLIRKIVRKISPHNQLFLWKTFQSSERTKATKGISGKEKNLGNFSGWSNILVTHISSPYQYFDPTLISRQLSADSEKWWLASSKTIFLIINSNIAWGKKTLGNQQLHGSVVNCAGPQEKYCHKAHDAKC